jgi:hypothetical protein
MTSLFVIWVPAPETGTKAALMELRALTSTGAFIVDGPIEVEGPIPSADPARLTKGAEILERAARSRKIGEGLARAKTEGRRIGRPPIDRPVTAAQIVLDRARGRSWSSIEAEYRIPKTSARRLYQKELRKQTVHRASRQEAKRP